MAETSALADVGVLITRPAHQAQALTQLIEAAGATAIHFPTIAILPPTDPTSLVGALERLAQFDIAIFVSANAVEYAFVALRNHQWPATMVTACVGNGTARALAEHGVRTCLTPKQHDSEGLLALPELSNVAGKHVAIFRGNGGRELLGQTLSARGASVSHIECYQRVRPTSDTSALRARVSRGEIHIAVVTSAEGLRNLCDMVDAGTCATLRCTPMIVLNQAQATIGRTLGFTQLLVAPDTSDMAILETIKTWRLGTLPDNLPGNW